MANVNKILATACENIPGGATPERYLYAELLLVGRIKRPRSDERGRAEAEVDSVHNAYVFSLRGIPLSYPQKLWPIDILCVGLLLILSALTKLIDIASRSDRAGAC